MSSSSKSQIEARCSPGADWQSHFRTASGGGSMGFQSVSLNIATSPASCLHQDKQYRLQVRLALRFRFLAFDHSAYSLL
jgi:hypothetical protein